MKKIILTIAAAFFLSFANAQEARFGAKGGMNFATLTNIDDSVVKIGYFAGGFGEFMVNDKFAVRPELVYSVQGAKMERSDTVLGVTVNTKDDLTLSYLNIPIMAKYFVTENISLEAGPQLGFLLNAKNKSEISGGGVSSSEEEDVKDMFEGFDYGINLGAGFDFTENFSAGVRYNLGLSQVQKELKDDESASKNSVIQISVGFKF